MTDQRIVTDGGEAVADHATEAALSHLPTVPETEAMRHWIRGFAEDLDLTVGDVRAGLRWADHALVVRSVCDDKTCWYYLDPHGELQLFSGQPAAHDADPARQLHADLHDAEVAVAVKLVADAPEPVQPSKEIVTDGGRDTPDRDERVRTRPTNGDGLNLTNGSGFDVPESPIVDSPKASPPDTRKLVRQQVIRDDDSDDHPTVTVCMDCLEYFTTASESWERCPKCGSGLVDVEPAGDAV